MGQTASQQNFIKSLIPGAKQGFTTYGVLASITIAQAIVESAWGTSHLAKNGYNLFGIKYPGNHDPTITITRGSWATDDGGYYAYYKSWTDSILDHGYFLKHNSRYASLIGDTNYVSVANKLQAAGYASSQTYASSLIGTVKANGLQQIDAGGTYTGTTAAVDSSSEAAQAAEQAVGLTNYSIDNSTFESKDILYGRRYRVLITDNSGVALDVSQLRCTFNIQKTMMQQPNYSEVCIYNLNAITENIVIFEGSRIVVEAGYEGNQYGKIFDGNILQPIRSKEDGVTFKLLLRSIDGDGFLNFGFTSFTLIKGQTCRNIVENCASKAVKTSEINSISDTLSEEKLTRGKVIFGLAKKYLSQIAESHEATFYVDDGKINIVNLNDNPPDRIIELSPTTGLIGVPEQNDYGVDGKCLLNPDIRLNSLIHIDSSLVIQEQVSLGQVVRTLDVSGIYRVIQVNYVGDTRGDDWYTEFKTVSQAGVLPSMLTSSTSNPW